ARARGAELVVLAVPCAPAGVDSLVPEADEVVCPERSGAFFAVGQFYARFGQVDDSEVLAALDDRGAEAPPRK
ncbi:MAG: phosphoribosyltransferase, partial [Microcella sp.]|nr:phosphoribosyltransferase [Microcella sp.]